MTGPGAPVTSPGALVAAAWLASPGAPRRPAGVDQPAGRLGRPLLAVCHVAAARVDATLCGLGFAPSGARLVRVLGWATAEGRAGTWFATEALRRAGADPAIRGSDGRGPLAWFAHALTAASRKTGSGANQLTELLDFAAGNPQFRNRHAVRFGPEDQYELTAANLLDGFEPVQETIERAVRDLLALRPDLLASAARDVGQPGVDDGRVGQQEPLVAVLLHGRTAVLPWAGAAASRAAVAALAAAGYPAEAVPAHVAPEAHNAVAGGAKVVEDHRVVVEDRRAHTVRLRTHRIENGQLAKGSVPVADTGDGWPRRAEAGGRPVVVQVDGSQGDQLTLELARGGRTTTGTAQVPAALLAGEYHVGLLAGWEPAGALVLSPADGGPERVLAVTGYPDG